MAPKCRGRLRGGTTWERIVRLRITRRRKVRVIALASAAVASVLAAPVVAGCSAIGHPPAQLTTSGSRAQQAPPGAEPSRPPGSEASRPPGSEASRPPGAEASRPPGAEPSRPPGPRPSLPVPHRPAPATLTPPELRAQAPRATRRRGSWLIAPDGPLPRASRWWSVLAVARRFAAADMSYEVGELGPTVRRVIAQTCTAAFAAGLLSHRAILPPGVSPRQVRQRLVGVQPLARLPDAAVVLATVRASRRGGPPGAFELRLVARLGGWRVAAVSVV
jgi:hypothetical protein